ncbi:biopolymer transporter ExbD [Myxococcota bacterium]|nr:biopolymer transporter ExbD [Myxococcota bacterium]
MMGHLPGADETETDDEAAIFSEINITPLTDIFLVLLIIFMVTSSVMANKAPPSPLQVDLPKGGEGAAAGQDTVISVLVGADGKVGLLNEVVEPKDLSARLVALHQEKPAAKLVVLADTSAAHGRVVWVMQVARFAGFQQLAVGTQAAGAAP